MVSVRSLGSIGAALALSATGACSSPEYPTCDNDSQCRRDGRREVCVDRHCQQCRVDGDCPAGRRCRANRCEAPAAQPECDARRACPGGAPCVAGRCGAPDEMETHSTDGGQCSFAEVHFGYNDDTLSPAARAALDRTVECLQRERTTHYVLIGRADPRGGTEYNLALGERRARAVQRYAVSLGVAEARLAVSSIGSEGATGTDEAGYERDRRVDPNRRDAPPATGDAGAPRR